DVDVGPDLGLVAQEAQVAEFAALRIRRPQLVVAVLIPLEVAVAAALVVAPAVGGIAAFALLAAMTTILVGVVRSGREATCRCFGALSSQPISPRTVARNAVLLTVAGAVALF
ncbi:MAG: MauE/DoxX family redox-associated membrane protein, partial [Actinomycetota bacterium]